MRRTQSPLLDRHICGSKDLHAARFGSLIGVVGGFSVSLSVTRPPNVVTEKQALA